MAAKAAINPSEESIVIGPIGVRFLLTGEDTMGSVSVFEMTGLYCFRMAFTTDRT